MGSGGRPAARVWAARWGPAGTWHGGSCLAGGGGVVPRAMPRALRFPARGCGRAPAPPPATLPLRNPRPPAPRPPGLCCSESCSGRGEVRSRARTCCTSGQPGWAALPQSRRSRALLPRPGRPPRGPVWEAKPGPGLQVPGAPRSVLRALNPAELVLRAGTPRFHSRPGLFLVSQRRTDSSLAVSLC